MTFNKFLKASTFLLVGIMFFSSCNKEADSVTIIEEEEELEIGIRMSINGNEISTNAVAAYCMTEGQEFFAIASEEDNLGFGSSTDDFEPNDFSFFKNISEETGDWSYGGMAFEGSTLGLDDITLAILFSDAEIAITSNDGDIVTGSASGTLLYFVDPLDPTAGLLEYPYSMRFVANIVQESDFCG